MAISNFYEYSQRYLHAALTFDAGDNALLRIFIDSMTPAINLSPVTMTPAMKH
jgi:hypothetical protein